MVQFLPFVSTQTDQTTIAITHDLIVELKPFSQVLGVDYLLGTDEGWPYLLGIAVFPRFCLSGLV